MMNSGEINYPANLKGREGCGWALAEIESEGAGWLEFSILGSKRVRSGRVLSI